MKPLRITVEPSAKHPDVLDVRDAMQQVLDFFDLLTDRSNANVVWNLTFASTNSPFVAEGQPIDLRTKAGAFGAVEHHVRTIERGFVRIAAGDPVDHDFPQDKLLVAERFLVRNLNGIGRTKCDFGGSDKTVEIKPSIAKRFLQTNKEEIDILYDYLFSTFARKESGSIEGRIVELGTHYDKPAVQIKEHTSDREIWCQVDVHALEEIEKKITAGDVWKHRRVRIRGEISYDANGKISRVYDGRIFYVEQKEVSIDDLYDPDFTENLPPYEYLDKLRENNFE